MLIVTKDIQQSRWVGTDISKDRFKSIYLDQISCVSSAVVKTIKVILKSDMVLGQAIAPPSISGVNDRHEGSYYPVK